MKLINKICCILLSVSMTLSICSFAEDVPADNNEKYIDSIQLLMATGIISENTGSECITRGDAAEIISNIVMAGNTVDVSYANSFEDVVGTKYASSVAILSASHIMNGSDNQFKPEQNITLFEIVKTVVAMLGYDVQANLTGGWITGYFTIAGQLGILSEIDNYSEHDISYGEFAQILRNAIEADLFEIKNIGNEYVTYSAENKTNILSKYYDIVKEKNGMFEADCVSSIYGNSGHKSDTVRIDGNDYLYSGTDSFQYIGYSVDYYYKTNDYNQNTLIYLSYNKNNTALELDRDDIESYSDLTYRYYVEGSRNLKTATLKSGVHIIYNGQIAKSSIVGSDFIPENGRVKLIDNDGDGNYDSLFIWNFNTYVVDKKIATSYTVSDYLSKESIKLDPNSDDYSLRMYKNGTRIGFDSIEKWNVLSVATSDSGSSKPLITVEVTSNRVTGTVEAYSDKDVTVDGGTYDFASSFNQVLTLGYILDFYLDNRGKVAVVNLKSYSVNVLYGIIVGISTGQGMSENCEAKIFTSDNYFKVYKLAASITIDGVKAKCIDVFSGTKDLFLGSSEYTNTLFNEDGFKPQLIGYKVDENDIITAIDTDNVLPTEDKEVTLTSTGEIDGQYWSLGSSIGESCFIASPATIFEVPRDENLNIVVDQKYESLFKVVTALTNQYSYTMKLFNCNDANWSKLCISYVAASKFETLTLDGRLVIVDSVIDRMDESGNMRTVIKTKLVGGGDFELPCLDDVTIDERLPGVTYTNRQYPTLTPKDLKKGDIIQYIKRRDSETGEGMAYFISRRYNSSNNNTYGLSNSNINAKGRIVNGIITAVSGDCLLVNYITDSQTGLLDMSKSRSRTVRINGSTLISCYKGKSGTPVAATYSDLAVGQHIVANMWTTLAENLIILE